jgi:hypothetical protein
VPKLFHPQIVQIADVRSRPNETPVCRILFCAWGKESFYISAKFSRLALVPATTSSDALRLKNSLARALKKFSSLGKN